MSTRKLEVNMSGWISEFKKDMLPSRQGVYLVFGGVACGTKNKRGQCEAHIKHLIYIGQSEDIQSRLESHEKNERFESALEGDETIFYYYIKVGEDVVDDCEGALIRHFRNTPIINKKCKQSFASDYDKVHVMISGRIPSILKNDREFEVKTNSKE